jgi:ATP-dependent protease HslVU (ClpYQ) peptidase subunit
MSVIVGVWDQVTGECVVGTDSQITHGETCFVDVQKAYPFRGVVFGFSGNMVRVQEILRFLRAGAAEPLASKDAVEDVILSANQHATSKLGAPSDDDDGESDDVWWLVGTPWGVASAAGNCISWRAEMTEGSGANYALGSLHATARQPSTSQVERVRLAVQAACDHNIYCRPPIQVFRVGG